MDYILNTTGEAGNQTLVILCLILALGRIYLEIIGLDLSKLPITSSIGSKFGKKHASRIHKFGLYISIGYIITHAPSLLL